MYNIACRTVLCAPVPGHPGQRAAVAAAAPRLRPQPQPLLQGEMVHDYLYYYNIYIMINIYIL